jgi:hypothetical protein
MITKTQLAENTTDNSAPDYLGDCVLQYIWPWEDMQIKTQTASMTIPGIIVQTGVQCSVWSITIQESGGMKHWYENSKKGWKNRPCI